MMWYWECFTPHPPVIVPEVGRGREYEASGTLEGMEKLSSFAGHNPPDHILLLSPHAPFSGGITLSLAEEYTGDFARFQAPRTSLSFRGEADEGERLSEFLSGDFPLFFSRRNACLLDHGSLVPLFFLRKGQVSPPPSIVIANPIGLSPADAFRLGERLFNAPLRGSWALIASGDLSHRVTPDAPAGYSPMGGIFDKTVVTALEKNDPSPLLDLSEKERDEAGECGLCSALVFLGLGKSRRMRLLSYEAPFGVGYATAFASLHSAASLAGAVLREGIRSGKDAARKASLRFRIFSELEGRAGCFVSLKKNGELRGCIGTISPSTSSLLEEITENTLSAAMRDPRFFPVSPEELQDITLSVDILSSPERISSLEQLDPHKYGVIVEKGSLRGVLLPDLDGVETVEQQLSIAARKAGISSMEGTTLFRFNVNRIREDSR